MLNFCEECPMTGQIIRNTCEQKYYFVAGGYLSLSAFWLGDSMEILTEVELQIVLLVYGKCWRQIRKQIAGRQVDGLVQPQI